MSWIFFALFSAIISGSRRAYEKNLTKSFGNFSMGFITQASSLLPMFVLLFFLPIPSDIRHLPWQFWWPLLIIWVLLYPIQTYFMYKSVREGEIVQVTPVKAVLPVFNMITSLILLKEYPTIFGLIGVIIIVAATHLLLSEGVEKESGKRYNRAVLYMIVAMACAAIGSTLDKISIGASTPVFYSFVNTLGASVVFLVLILFLKQEKELKQIRTRVWPIALLGFALALAYNSTMTAFSKGPTAYVLAIQATGFLFAVFWGVFFMEEKLSDRRILSLVLFILGIVFITLIK